jgi:FtsH-binding integral membrane protein
MQSGQIWLMFACALHVPLALAAVLPRLMSEAEERRWTGLLRWWVFAALGLVISFLLEPGRLAAGFALPWLLFAVGLAITSTWFTLRYRRKGPWHEILLGLAALNFAGSAVWLIAQRGGWMLLGFDEPWVTWTAAHFLVLGTTTLIVAAVVGRSLPVRRRHGLLALMFALAMPVTAAGIQFGLPLIERIGAWNTAGAASWLALEILACRSLGFGWRRPALDLAAVCLLGGVALAVAYTLNVIFQWGAPSLEFMARWHAGLNTLGFGVPALAALATRPPDRGNRPLVG